MLSLRWRRIGAVFAGGLVALAAVLAVLAVQVRGDDGVIRGCGSSFDVLAGRTDWQVWRAQDLLDLAPAASGTGALTRTAACPTAVNARTAWTGGLLVAAAVVAVLSWPRRAASSRTAKRRDLTRRLAMLMLSVGCALTVAGLAGVALLVANPKATLFLYVGRPVVVLIGLLLLAPAVALMFAGWALIVATRGRTIEPRAGDEE